MQHVFAELCFPYKCAICFLIIPASKFTSDNVFLAYADVFAQGIQGGFTKGERTSSLLYTYIAVRGNEWEGRKPV
jgi:hypothetical protein